MGDVLEKKMNQERDEGEKKKDKASRLGRMSDAVLTVAGELVYGSGDWLFPLNRASGLRWIGPM